MTRAALRPTLAALGLLALLAPARAGDGAVEYGPVPAPLAAVRGTPGEEAIAAASLAALEQLVATGRPPAAALGPRARLLLLDPVGLRVVAERLARGGVDALLLPHLLHVVAASDHEAADALLARAAGEDRAELRLMAAEGLGWGRTPAATTALARLAADPLPGVRAVALRSLFALEDEASVAARAALPVDADLHLLTRRIRWHRLRGDASPALRPLALRLWRAGSSAPLRLEAARLLARPGLLTPPEVLERVVVEMGTDPLGAALTRRALGVPLRGYDAVAMRQAALEAAWVAMHHPAATQETRRRMVDLAVGWLARPVATDPRTRRPIPEDALRMLLPDLGERVREPVLRRLRAGLFRDPQDGIRLLLEALDPSAALAALQDLVRPEAAAPAAVRRAAAGGLRDVGAVGDAALAASLLEPQEPRIVRADVIAALRTEPAPWAVDLLARVVASEDPALVPLAVRALEARPEEAARLLLADRLFATGELPHQRLGPLVDAADATAFAILERALGDRRVLLRLAALEQIQRRPALQTDRGRALVLSYEPRGRGRNVRTNEIQGLLYARMAIAPLEAVRYVREYGDELEALDWTATALRNLQNVSGDEVNPAVVDLVLEVSRDRDDLELLVGAATALQGRCGWRDAEVTAFWRRLLSDERPVLVWTAVSCLNHPGCGDLLDLLIPLLESVDLRDPDLADNEGDRLVRALEHQPWEGVEPHLLDVTLDRDVLATVRWSTAALLVGRVSPAGRERLLAWLVDPETANEDYGVQRLVARAAGVGADPEAAARLVAALQRALDERKIPADVDAFDEGEGMARIAALAHAIAYAEQEEATARVAAMVFDPRYAPFARRAVALQARRMASADASAAAGPSPELDLRLHGGRAATPVEVRHLVRSLKPAPDEVLASSLGAVLDAHRRSGVLAGFPDLYLYRVSALLHHRPTGDRARAAATVNRHAWRAEPVGGSVDLAVAEAEIERLAEAGRFEEAAGAQATVVAIVARRDLDEETPGRWERERAALDALRGAAAAAAGRDEEARVAFARGVRRSPHDPALLNLSAWYRALAGFDLEAARREAERAAVLERRAWDTPTLPTLDTLAFVLVRQGRHEDAVDVLAARVEGERPREAVYYRRLAQAYCGTGDLDAAADAVLEALAREPTLDEALRGDPHLAPLRDAGRLEALVAEAYERALRVTE